MGIDFGRGDVRMPEEFLDDAKVGPPCEQVGGETVTKHVRVDMPEPGLGGVVANDDLQACPRQRAAVFGQKNTAFVRPVRSALRVEQSRAAISQVIGQCVGGGNAHGNEPLLSALAHDPQRPGSLKPVTEFEHEHFRRAQPAGIHEFENRPVPDPERERVLVDFIGRVRGFDEVAELFGREDAGEFTPLVRSFEQFGQVSLHPAGCPHPA